MVTMLEELVRGGEAWRCALIIDSAEARGAPLLTCFLRGALQRCEASQRCVLLHGELPVTQLLASVSEGEKAVLDCCDVNCVLSKLPTAADGEELCSRVAAAVTNSGAPPTASVFVECGSLLAQLMSGGSRGVRPLLQLLSRWTAANRRVLLLVHSTCHSQAVLAQLRYLAGSVLSVTLPSISSTFHLHVRLTHQRRQLSSSCKIVVRHLDVQLSPADGATLLRTVDAEASTAALTAEQQRLQTSAPEEAAPDPAANLSFNLKLTEREKAARQLVQLPYMRQINPNEAETGRIVYEPDYEDDFDDEDPDDDLDI